MTPVLCDNTENMIKSRGGSVRKSVGVEMRCNAQVPSGARPEIRNHMQLPSRFFLSTAPKVDSKKLLPSYSRSPNDAAIGVHLIDLSASLASALLARRCRSGL